MATNLDIESSDANALRLLFCKGVGLHLGAIKPFPFSVRNQGLYDLIQDQFMYQLKKGWKFGELEELLKEAKRLGRLVKEPADLVFGKTPRGKLKDKERNLLDYIDKDTLYFHPALQIRHMPCVVLTATPHGLVTKSVEDGRVGGFIESFTLQNLIEYWENRIGDTQADSVGQFEWLLSNYSLPDILYAIDDMTLDMRNERDLNKRKRVSVFDLRVSLINVQKQKEEITRWN